MHKYDFGPLVLRV